MAIIKVFPNSSTAIQDAVTLANEGDVIMVHRGIYYEEVQISSDRNNIRIISKHKYGAILDGRRTLLQAFALNGAAGVEINGFKIKNYNSVGIRILSGKSNRIIDNKISDIRGGTNPLGIIAGNSVGNLLWNNSIRRIGRARVGTGIQLQVATGNWVINNKLRYNAAYGLEVIDSSHNAVAGNVISFNRADGIRVSGSDNQLILDNELQHNRDNGVNAQSTNNLVLNNEMNRNRKSGMLSSFNYNLAGFNRIINNKQSGINVFSNFNDIQNNTIERNNNNGVFIQAPYTANLVYENQFKHNKPRDIENQGTNNNILRNSFGKNKKS